MLLLAVLIGPIEAVVVLSSRSSQPALITTPFESVIPSSRHVKVVPSTTKRPVVDGTLNAVTVVSDRVRRAADL